MQKSIVTNHHGRRLLESLPDDGTCNFIQVKIFGKDVTFSARRCSRWAHRQYHLTGGVVLSADLPTPTYGGRRRRLFVNRKPNWKPEQFVNAFASLYRLAKAEMELDAPREAVYALAQQLPESDEFWAKVEAAEKEGGHTCIYDEMTLADTEFWREWLATVVLIAKGDQT